MEIVPNSNNKLASNSKWLKTVYSEPWARVPIPSFSIQIKKKKEKLHDSLKHRLANDAKKLTEKIKAINGEIKTSNKTYEKASEKLVNLKQQILNVQGDLDSARISYSTLEQKCRLQKNIHVVCDYSRTMCYCQWF